MPHTNRSNNGKDSVATTIESYDASGNEVTNTAGDPAINVIASGVNFTPTSTGSATLTMDGTAQGGALSTGVTKIQVYNSGATTEGIYIAFGATQAAADDNLGPFATAIATTGHYIPPVADVGALALQVLGVPTAAYGGFYAVANSVVGDVQVVQISQGV